MLVRHHYDDYTGWVDLQQVHALSEEEYQKLLIHRAPVVAQLVHYIQTSSIRFPVLLGSSLPFYEHGKLQLAGTYYYYQGNVYDTSYPKQRGFILQVARQYLHAPYQWGGRSPFGIDCSGFVQMVFKAAGYRLPRDAHQQAEQGIGLASLSQAEPGDVAFFERDGRIVHTGIILEEQKIIHARGRVRIDLLDERGILDIQTQSYSHVFSHVKRFIGQNS